MNINTIKLARKPTNALVEMESKFTMETMKRSIMTVDHDVLSGFVGNIRKLRSSLFVPVNTALDLKYA